MCLWPACATEKRAGWLMSSLSVLFDMAECQSLSIFLLLGCAAWIWFDLIFMYPRSKRALATKLGISLGCTKDCHLLCH